MHIQRLKYEFTVATSRSSFKSNFVAGVLYMVSQKVDYQFVAVTLLSVLTDFLKFFTTGKSIKFPTELLIFPITSSACCCTTL